MPQEAPAPSARREVLLEAAYQYALTHGLADLSLRPLAGAIGSSPRVLLFLFESKDGLLRALLARARADQLALLERAGRPDRPAGLAEAVERVWTWLAAKEHRPLLRLWAEAYARSLGRPEGVWAGFARATVDDWLRRPGRFPAAVRTGRRGGSHPPHAGPGRPAWRAARPSRHGRRGTAHRGRGAPARPAARRGRRQGRGRGRLTIVAERAGSGRCRTSRDRLRPAGRTVETRTRLHSSYWCK